MAENYYLKQQLRLASKKWLRWFWLWWAIYCLFIVFVIGAYLLAINKWRDIALVLASLILARLIIGPLIYVFYKSSHPYQDFKFTTLHSRLFSLATVRQNAFPSDHATAFAAIAAALFFHFPALGIFIGIVGVINSWARMVLGYHYFYQILAGWIVGIISALIVIHWLGPIIFR